MNARGALREGALWGSAAVVVLTAHLGTLWVLHRAEAAAPPGLPAPVFVELEPMPEAPAPQDEAESPEQAESEPEPAPEPEPEPEPEPAPDFAMDQPLPQLEPLPDMNSLFPPPPEAVVLQESARPKPRPEIRPEPEPEPEPRIVRKQPAPKKEAKKETKKAEAQPERKASTTVKAQPAQRTAAPSGGGGQPSPRQIATWQSRVNSIVSRHMDGVKGGMNRVSITVLFTIQPNGSVTGGRLAGSTGDARVDRLLARQVRRLPRVPPHPSGKAQPMQLPVTIE